MCDGSQIEAMIREEEGGADGRVEGSGRSRRGESVQSVSLSEGEAPKADDSVFACADTLIHYHSLKRSVSVCLCVKYQVSRIKED